MITLTKITWQDFEKVIKIFQSYRQIAKSNDQQWIESILAKLLKIEKQAYNIKIEDLDKEDLYKIIVLVDMWNSINNSVDEEFSYEEEYDKISSKLQKVYFNNFAKHVFLED